MKTEVFVLINSSKLFRCISLPHLFIDVGFSSSFLERCYRSGSIMLSGVSTTLISYSEGVFALKLRINTTIPHYNRTANTVCCGISLVRRPLRSRVHNLRYFVRRLLCRKAFGFDDYDSIHPVPKPPAGCQSRVSG